MDCIIRIESSITFLQPPLQQQAKIPSRFGGTGSVGMNNQSLFVSISLQVITFLALKPGC